MSSDRDVGATLLLTVTGSYYLLSRLADVTNVLYPWAHERVAVLNVILAYSFIDHGLSTYTFRTFAESMAGVHVFSLTGVPFVATLGPVGLRIYAMILGALFLAAVYGTGAELYDRRTGALAALLAALSPMLLLLTNGPMAAIFETTAVAGSVLAYIYYDRTDRRLWFGLSVGLLAVGIADHLWAVTAMAPLVLVAWERRQRVAAGVYALVGVLAVVGTWKITEGYTTGGGGGILSTPLIRAYSVLFHAEYFTHPYWWRVTILNRIGHTITPHLAFVAFLLCGWIVGRWLRSRGEVTDPFYDHLLLATWLASSLAFPLLFPRGAQYHVYYYWGVIAPAALLVAWFTLRVVASLDAAVPSVPKRFITLAVVFLLVTSYAPSYYVAGQRGLTNSLATPHEGRQQLVAGEEIRAYRRAHGIDSTDVAVVATSAVPIQRADTKWAEDAHTYLMYARLYMRAPNSPTRYRTLSEAKASGAALIIDFRNSSVDLRGDGPRPTRPPGVYVSTRDDGAYRNVTGQLGA